MKKIFYLLIMMLMVFVVSACEQSSTQTKTLPDLTGMNREQIKEKLASLGINYVFKFADTIIESPLDLDLFVKYNGDLKAGDVINAGYQVYVYTTVLPLTFSISDEVKIDFEYENKSFVNDGVGEVELVYATDGDTASFRDVITNDTFRVRFLGIDTPESTIDKDPWGKAASTYTSNRLYQASTIVLESEGSRQDVYDRYLAFVWVDGVLLNLEIVEQAYSNSTLVNSKYETFFSLAASEAKKTGRRFYGETDPNYDYLNKRFK